MKKELFILLSGALLFLALTSGKGSIDTQSTLPLTKDKDSSLIWSPDRKLVWQDFHGKPDKRSGYNANTSARISYDTEWFDDSVVILVSNYFEPGESWVLGEGTNDLLAHEQGHFDIAEIVARKMRKELSMVKPGDMQTTSTKLNAIYKKHATKTWSYYERYDQETKHGIVKEKQKQWLERIDTELSELSAYSSSRIVLKKN